MAFWGFGRLLKVLVENFALPAGYWLPVIFKKVKLKPPGPNILFFSPNFTFVGCNCFKTNLIL